MVNNCPNFGFVFCKPFYPKLNKAADIYKLTYHLDVYSQSAATMRKSIDHSSKQTALSSKTLVLCSQIYNCTERKRERTWKTIRKFISKPKYEYRYNKRSEVTERTSDIPMTEISPDNNNSVADDVPLLENI